MNLPPYELYFKNAILWYFFLNDAQQIKSYYRHHQNIYDFIYISIVIEISITPVRVHVHWHI